MNLTPQNIRKRILKMAFQGQSVHVPCAFSIVEILCSLYSQSILMSHSESKRNRFVLSKGHGVMALYAVLTEIGVLKESELETYFKDGSNLHGLAEWHTEGLEASSGSLGHGLPIATGMALAFKKQNKTQQVFCLAGDGEMAEGPMWESMLFASHHKLNNLTLIVDANKWQAMGTTEEVLDLESLDDKFNAFGFYTKRCSGHNVEEVSQAINNLSTSSGSRPKALIADTVKGWGVSFMENNNSWHYTKLNKETYEAALKEIENA